jgi:hypothetical protein
MTPLALTEMVVLYICPACNGSGCRMCCGRGRVPHDPYRRGAGEQGDDFHDLAQPRHGAQREAATHEGSVSSGGRRVHETPAAEPSLRGELEALVDRAQVVCPACVIGAGQCDSCNGTGWVFAEEARR